jgi:membrane protein implicated in regulation of membrane protease activity
MPWCHLLLGLPVGIAAAVLFLPPAQAWPTVAILSALSVFVGLKSWQAMRHSVAVGREAMKGKLAEVRRWSGRAGLIHYRGELWSAKGPEGLQPGDWVRITELEGVKALVERVSSTSAGGSL